jgi:hypothetical protein
MINCAGLRGQAEWGFIYYFIDWAYKQSKLKRDASILLVQTCGLDYFGGETENIIVCYETLAPNCDQKIVINENEQLERKTILNKFH